MKLMVMLLVLSPIAHAQWQPNGVPICDTTGNTGNTFPAIAPDGEGGAYICWQDRRNITVDLYAQRVDSMGRIQWQYNGLPVVTMPQGQSGQRMINDDAGNLIVAWTDDRSGNSVPYAQKMSKNGQPLWQLNGKKVVEIPAFVQPICSDNANGFIVGMENVRDAFVQRLDSSGDRLWGDSGVQVTNRAPSISSNDVWVINDGQKGAIVTWSEGNLVYAQRVDSSGQVKWQTNGVLLSGTTGSNVGVGCSSDMRGGAIVSWGNLEEFTTYAQRVDSNGVVRWQQGGISLGNSAGGGAHRNISDGKGGAFIGHGIYLQHVDSSGVKLWNPTGVRFTTLQIPGNQSIQTQSPDGGVWNFWTAYPYYEAVYRQWVDATGTIRWTSEGLPVTTARSAYSQAVNVSGFAAIVCWEQGYGAGYARVYAAKIDTTGVVTSVAGGDNETLPSHPTLSQNYPNPFNGQTSISFTLPAKMFVSLKIFDTLGREVRTLVDEQKEEGSHAVQLHLDEQSTGVYYCRLVAGGKTLTQKITLIR